MENVINRKGWGKVKDVAVYAGISERTLEKWIKEGLEVAHLPSGLRLISYDTVDAYLRKLSKSENQVDRIADETLAEFKSHLDS